MNALAKRSYELAAENLKRAVFLNKKALDAELTQLVLFGGSEELNLQKRDSIGQCYRYLLPISDSERKEFGIKRIWNAEFSSSKTRKRNVQ